MRSRWHLVTVALLQIGYAASSQRLHSNMTTSATLHGVTDQLSPENEKYANVLQTGVEAFNDAYAIFADPDFEAKRDWKLEADDSNAKVHSKQFPFGKVFSLTTALPAPLEVAFDESVRKFDQMSSWNDNILFSKKKSLTEHLDMLHYANPDVMIVQSRDYVAAQLWRKIDDVYYIAARSTEVNEIPENRNHVRAKLYLACGRMRAHPTEADKTSVDYLLCIDFGGYVPKFVINAVMGKLVIKDYEQTLAHYRQVMGVQ